VGVVENGIDQAERFLPAMPGAGADGPAPDAVEWLDPAQQRAWRGLQVMQARLMGALASQLAAESDLSLADYVVLVVLTESPYGALRTFEIARLLGWERSRVSHHIARMASRGLVTKRQCAADRRGSFVVVTDEGRRAIESAAPGHVATVRKYFIDPLTDEQLDTIGDVSGRVVEAIDRAEQFDGGASSRSHRSSAVIHFSTATGR
jgi:DNA-binding MarR family transcriptional regulator